jgi:hypothetical protein
VTDLWVLVPTRGRPQQAAELAQAFTDTIQGNTKMWFVVDVDDPTRNEYIDLIDSRYPGVSPILAEGGTMVKALNEAAGVLVTDLWHTATPPRPFAIGFMGDDHRPRTIGWDAEYVRNLRLLGTGMVYGNDLLQGESLPTQIAMTADIVRTLGWMAPPMLTHLYVDNSWLLLGRAIDRIRYLPDVIIEHMHPVAGKAPWDEGYRRVNHGAIYQGDEAAHNLWVKEGGLSNCARLLRAMIQTKEPV